MYYYKVRIGYWVSFFENQIIEFRKRNNYFFQYLSIKMELGIFFRMLINFSAVFFC